MARTTKRLAVVSGNIVEFYEYENPITIGQQSKNPNGRRGKKEEDDTRTETEREESRRAARAATLSKARRSIRRLVNANAQHLTKFITLTFADNVSDLDYCNAEFHLFVKRLNYYLKINKQPPLQYIMVTEFQKRGAAHYHMIANVPYISNAKLQEIWRHGFVRINAIDHVSNVGAYVSKYLQKDLDDVRLQGRRAWNASRNLDKPKEIYDEKELDALVKRLAPQNLTYQSTYENEYRGTILYKQYNTNLR